MRFERARAVARAALALVCGALTAVVLVVLPGNPARALPLESHEPGLYLALGAPTQLMRGAQGSDGAISFEPVGAPAPRSYNALAAHLPDRALYAIADQSGDLLRVLADGSTRTVMPLDASSVVGAFADSAHPDRMYYVPRGAKRLAWVDVVTQERGGVPMDASFAPVDFTWSSGYLWGLRVVDRRAVLTRLGLDGRIVETPLPAVDGTRFGSGSFGGAWTYGNGSLGFLANSGGAVQLRVSSADPVRAELIGYADSPASNNLDAALIPAPPVHLSVRAEASWSGPRTPLLLTAVVRNDGSTDSSGYQLDFGPERLDSRAVKMPNGCAAASGRYLCAGGPLKPGEERHHEFALSMVSAGASHAPDWTARVHGNEEDPAPASEPVPFPVLAPAPVLIDTDVKARVVDARREGTVTAEKPVQVFVLIRNRGNAPLEGVRASIDFAPWPAQTLDDAVEPGELRTIRFEGRVADLRIGGIVQVSTTVTARAGGAEVRVQSNALALSGVGIRANPGGLGGPQPAPVGNIDPLDPPPPFVIMPDDATPAANADGASGAGGASGTAAGGSAGSGGAGNGSGGTGTAVGAGAPGAGGEAGSGTADSRAAADAADGTTGGATRVDGAGGAAARTGPAVLSATGAATAPALPAIPALLVLGGGALAAYAGVRASRRRTRSAAR